MSGNDPSIKIRCLLAGKPEPFAGTDVVSAIAKIPIEGPVEIGSLGFVSDQQADTRLHGGMEKAVHHYPFDHYASWRAELPATSQEVLRQPGAFGENISTVGLTESDVCVGDIWRTESVVLQISQGRQPCFKLNHRFHVPDMAQRVQQSMRTGWYYRVLEAGKVYSGASMHLEQRPLPEWPVSRMLNHLYIDTLNIDALHAISDLKLLTEPWRQLARRRIQTRSVENWSKRQNGT